MDFRTLADLSLPPPDPLLCPSPKPPPPPLGIPLPYLSPAIDSLRLPRLLHSAVTSIGSPLSPLPIQWQYNPPVGLSVISSRKRAKSFIPLPDLSLPLPCSCSSTFPPRFLREFDGSPHLSTADPSFISSLPRLSQEEKARLLTLFSADLSFKPSVAFSLTDLLSAVRTGFHSWASRSRLAPADVDPLLLESLAIIERAFLVTFPSGTAGTTHTLCVTRDDRLLLKKASSLFVSFAVDKFSHNVAFSCPDLYDFQLITELNNLDYYGALPDALGPEDVSAIAAPRFLKQLQLLPVISLHPTATLESTARIGSLHRMVKIDKNKGRFIIAQCVTYREPGGAVAALVLSHLWESHRAHLLRQGHMYDLPLWPFLKDGADFALFLRGVKDDIFSLFTADATRFFTNLPAQDYLDELTGVPDTGFISDICWFTMESIRARSFDGLHSHLYYDIKHHRIRWGTPSPDLPVRLVELSPLALCTFFEEYYSFSCFRYRTWVRYQKSGIIIGDQTGTHGCQITLLRRWLRVISHLYHSPWRSYLFAPPRPLSQVKGYVDDWFSANALDFHPAFTGSLFHSVLIVEPTVLDTRVVPGLGPVGSLVNFLDITVSLRPSGTGAVFSPFSKPPPAKLPHIHKFTDAHSCFPPGRRRAVLTGAFISAYRRSHRAGDFIKAASSVGFYLIRFKHWSRREVLRLWQRFLSRVSSAPVSWLPTSPTLLRSYTRRFSARLPTSRP
ncbi:hypothetical protein CYMTET_50867 [Cymbomonas tetramitiformis]|uniref:Uncharacterized protein n=1 Tax=Cymbomonas tetramitiformis TaxID=36881 RepID=A0AAE0BM74_9CHLO|nr:hypothetical protein CYMTET_50867 [Cymbomonas tetramitiformis]